MSEEQREIHRNITDLTLCGICSSPGRNPKVLPCLHTFCLACIEEWAKGKADRLTCPVCKDDFPLPSKGVSELRSDFFVTRLKEREALKEELDRNKPTCTFCEESNNTATARCLDCKDYLCDNCVGIHKTVKKLKGHKVYSLDDLKSGNIGIDTIPVKEYCTRHEGQVLWFFCDTCSILICRDCTVVDHPASTHMLVNVEEISGIKGGRLEELSARCQTVEQQVSAAMKVARGVESDLTVALEKAKADVDHFVAKIKDLFLTNLKHREQELINKITQIGDERKLQIELDKDALQSKHLQLKRALEMTAYVTASGSPYDLAAMYTSLTDTLQKLSSINPGVVPQALSAIKFVAEKGYEIKVPEFGKLATGHDVRGTWGMVAQFGKMAGLKDSMGIAFYYNGDNAIADYSTAQVKVFDQDGQFKYNIDVRQDSQISGPRGVVVSRDGSLFLTDTSAFVKVFDPKAKLINKFVTIPPKTTKLGVRKTAVLSGLAIDNEDQVIVGETTHNYISIHKCSSEHISSFAVGIEPRFVAVAHHAYMIIISNGSSHAHIMDYKGQILHTLKHPPNRSKIWNPTGAYFNGDRELLIASQAESFTPGGIYRYSTNGEYLGCVTNEVENPTDVVIIEDGKLMVLEWTHVEIFRKKRIQ